MPAATVVVKAEIPRVDPKEIEVSMRDGYLTIKGEKKDASGRPR